VPSLKKCRNTAPPLLEPAPTSQRSPSGWLYTPYSGANKGVSADYLTTSVEPSEVMPSPDALRQWQ